jgi:hypothetical protein
LAARPSSEIAARRTYAGDTAFGLAAALYPTDYPALPRGVLRRLPWT